MSGFSGVIRWLDIPRRLGEWFLTSRGRVVVSSPGMIRKPTKELQVVALLFFPISIFSDPPGHESAVLPIAIVNQVE